MHSWNEYVKVVLGLTTASQEPPLRCLLAPLFLSLRGVPRKRETPIGEILLIGDHVSLEGGQFYLGDLGYFRPGVYKPHCRTQCSQFGIR